MTFDEVWPLLVITGELDALDQCEQHRWRVVLQQAFDFGRAVERERCCRVVVVQRDDRLLEVARRTILAIRSGDDYFGEVDEEGLLRS